MVSQIPSTAVVRERLSPLGHAQLHRLAEVSGVPFTTLWKIKDGTTCNPGLETVNKFWPHITAAAEKAKAA